MFLIIRSVYWILQKIVYKTRNLFQILRITYQKISKDKPSLHNILQPDTFSKSSKFPKQLNQVTCFVLILKDFKIFLKSQFKFYLKVLFHNHFFLQESSVSIIQGILLEKDIQCLMWMISIFRIKLPSWLKFHVVFVPQRNLCKNSFGYNLDNKVTYHTIMIFFLVILHKSAL